LERQWATMWLQAIECRVDPAIGGLTRQSLIRAPAPALWRQMAAIRTERAIEATATLRPMPRPLSLPVFCVLALVAGCGGGGSEAGAPHIPGTAAPAADRVIYEWVNALRAGDVERAASYFALPSLAANGTPPLRLATRAETIAFNRSLPCGARLVHADAAGRFVNATFRLTERPGGDCGPGTGGTARTAFVIKDGKIVEWRRLPDRPRGPSNAPIA